MREPASTPPEQGSADEAREVAALRSRLDALKADLGTAQKEEQAKTASTTRRNDGSAVGNGLRAGSELLAGVLVGGAIGYFLDRQTGLSPLFLITFVLIGMGAGFWNVYRLSVPMARQRPSDETKD